MSKKRTSSVAPPSSSGPGSEYAYRRVWEINQLLVPKPHDFISTSRFFVKEGMLVMWDDKKRCKVKRYCFLFNDLFLFTIPKKKGKKFQLLIYMTLRTPSVSVEGVDNSSFNSEFRLHARRKSFIFFSETEEDRKYWVKALEASIKGTHPEERHTKAVHQQAKDIVKAPVSAAVHNDDDAEMTIYSSGSGDASEDDSPSPVTSAAGGKTTTTTTTTTIDFSTSNPFASTNAASPFATTPNPFMTGVARAPTGGAGFAAPFATTPAGMATNNPFLTNAAGQTVTTTYTQVVATGGANPFTTNNPFNTQPVAPFATTPVAQPGVNPFATNTANPFMTSSYH